MPEGLCSEYLQLFVAKSREDRKGGFEPSRKAHNDRRPPNGDRCQPYEICLE